MMITDEILALEYGISTVSMRAKYCLMVAHIVL